VSEENKDLIIIEAVVTPAILSVDFDKVKAELKSELEQYEIVVTGDTVGGAKELATKLNKTAGAIDTRRKELVSDASAPIKEFDTNMKELVQLCQTGRADILGQVKTFEDETRAKVRQLLAAAVITQYDAWEVGEEFQTVTTEDLVILSNVTSKGNLSKAAREAVAIRVINQYNLEGAVKIRLLELENSCYKAGLKSPLTRTHINHFLFDELESYVDKLAMLIDVELTRQEQAEQQQERKSEAQSKTKAQPKKVAGKKNWAVVAEFAIETSDTVTADKVTAALTKKMAEAGFTTLSSVKVVEV